ncbi:ANKS1A (predicted) [Pycnogonum litorale]
MENQSDDVKLQVTVSSRPGRRGGGGGGAQHVYENVFIDDTKAAAVKLESSNNNNNNHRNNSNNNVTIMSPFDENAEWAEIADIFASFGSGIARESVFMRDMEDKFASTLSLGAKKSDSSDTNDDADVTFDTVADWLNHVKLVDYQPLFINNGFDDVHFMHGLLEDQDLVDIGISNAEHRDRILKACKRLPPIKQVGKETDDKGGLKIRPERVDEWLKSIRLYKYKDAFHKNDYTDMYKVMKVWEVELNTVLEIHKVGHRKRILASLGERIANQYMNLPDVDLKDLDIDLSKLELDASTSSPITKEPVYPTVTKETGSLFRDYTNLKPVAPPKVPAGWKSAKAAAPKTDVTVRPPSGLTDIPSTESKQEDIGIRSPAELFSGIPTSLTTQWRHDPQALIRGSCNYTAKYLGSTLVKELKGMESTRKSIQKLKNSTKEIGKIPNVVLSMSYKGVNFIDAHTKKMVCAHEIQNIDCACQDADDLNHFAYITKEHSTSHHFCHVFSCTSMDLATEIILTLGEAFEVAYQLALREKNEKTDCKPDDVKIAETKKKCSSKPS